MNRSAQAAVLGSVVVAGLSVLGTPLAAQSQNGAIYTQCPGDTNNDGIPDGPAPGHPNVKCMHLAGGDGFVTMADGKPLYTFGFSDVTGLLPSQVVNGTESPRRPGGGQLPGADHRAEGGAGVLPVADQRRDDHAPRPLRPALGALPRLPAGGVGVRRRARVLRHRQHGLHLHLLLQDRRRPGRDLHVPLPRRGDRAHPDGDGRQPLHRPEAERHRHRSAATPPSSSTTTATAPRATTSSTRSSSAPSTPNFHEQHIAIQPLPFAAMDDKYPMLNGRGYPDTVNAAVINTDAGFGNLPSQPINSKITATAGQKVLLRLSNLAVTRFYTLASTIPMHVVGHNAKLLRGDRRCGSLGRPLLQDQLGDARRRRIDTT